MRYALDRKGQCTGSIRECDRVRGQWAQKQVQQWRKVLKTSLWTKSAVTCICTMCHWRCTVTNMLVKIAGNRSVPSKMAQLSLFLPRSQNEQHSNLLGCRHVNCLHHANTKDLSVLISPVCPLVVSSGNTCSTSASVWTTVFYADACLNSKYCISLASELITIKPSWLFTC